MLLVAGSDFFCNYQFAIRFCFLCVSKFLSFQMLNLLFNLLLLCNWLNTSTVGTCQLETRNEFSVEVSVWSHFAFQGSISKYTDTTHNGNTSF